MSTTLIDPSLPKKEKYIQIYQITKLALDHEPNLIANLANFTAQFKQAFEYLWVGFYIVEKDVLRLGPFQGNPACTRIAYGKGVCGTAWQQQQTIIVDDVHKFPGYITCDSQANSEIVVPVFNGRREVVAVLDIDSKDYADFDEEDKKYLDSIALLFSLYF